MAGADPEIERLRTLVGPSEAGYLQLRDDLAAAEDAARSAELAAGELRGRLEEMSVQLARARQDQDTMARRREMGAGAHFADLGREYWREVIRPLLARVARRTGLRRR